jgi:hypothetical protein
LPEKRRFELLERMKSQQRSPKAPSKLMSQPLISANPASPVTPTIPPEDGRPLHTVDPYFQVRRSPKGGYGAFALQDIPPYTEILSEHALLQATSSDILQYFERLSEKDKEVFMLLASFDKLDWNKVVAIYKTNRCVISLL